MSTVDPTRHLRTPVSQAIFDRKTLITVPVPAKRWVNLRWAKYAKPDTLFFASQSARLTPSSGKIDCLYLSPSERTAFLELYGDKIHLAHEAALDPVIEASDFTERVFIDVDLPDVTLLDITTGPGIECIDLDLGTLYASDPTYPRAFAERVAAHSAKVDGFLYESRHTKEICAAVWNVHRPALSSSPWNNQRSLGSLVKTLTGGTADVLGCRLQIAS